MGQSWALERSREITGECCSVKVAQALPLALSPTSEWWRDFRDLKKKNRIILRRGLQSRYGARPRADRRRRGLAGPLSGNPRPHELLRQGWRCELDHRPWGQNLCLLGGRLA